MTKGIKIGLIIAMVCFVIVSSAAVIMTTLYVKGTAERANTVALTNGTAPAKVTNVSADTGEKLSVADIAEKVSPAIVSIRVESLQSDFFGRTVSSSGSGSGIIFDEKGYIMTNNHVISNASNVKVKLSDGKEYDARLIGANSEMDLAVLKIEATGLPYAVLGDSDKLKVGEMAVAMGDPLGELSGTVTTGIISATDRELTISDNIKMKLIQTDATVNPGNSGGALCNEYGEVIGVVNAKVSATGVEGLGFAIPINDVKPIIKDLIEKGSAITNNDDIPTQQQERIYRNRDNYSSAA